MKLNLIMSLFVLTSGIKAYAAEDVKVIESSPTKLVYRDTSEANRIGKNFSLSLEAFGLGPMGTVESGFSGAYHLDRNNLVQLEVAGGGHESYSDSWFSAKYSGKRVGVHFKHYSGNSFYFKTGLDYRSVKLRNIDYDYNDNVTSDYEFEGNVLSAGFVIGNQWQWENFTLGCDWVGISTPLSSKVTRENITVADFYSSSSMQHDEEMYLERSNVQLLRFYVGYAF